MHDIIMPLTLLACYNKAALLVWGLTIRGGGGGRGLLGGHEALQLGTSTLQE